MGYSERLAETLPRVRATIATAAMSAGRAPEDVKLIAVTKGHSSEAVRAALDAGLLDLGENRVGELETKAALFEGEDIVWHLIGHVQGRKAGRAVANAELIHSVDTLRLAQRVGRAVEEAGTQAARVLFQVNTSGEEAKSGFPWEGALEALLEASDVSGLRVEGLMTMAPLTADERLLRMTFSRLRELGEALASHRPEVGRELSMGMTNDLTFAIAEGSTMVRVGTALFGERSGGTT